MFGTSSSSTSATEGSHISALIFYHFESTVSGVKNWVPMVGGYLEKKTDIGVYCLWVGPSDCANTGRNTIGSLHYLNKGNIIFITMLHHI